MEVEPEGGELGGWDSDPAGCPAVRLVALGGWERTNEISKRESCSGANLPTEQTPAPEGFTCESHVCKKQNSTLTQTQNNKNRKMPSSFCEAIITLTSKPEGNMKKKNYKAISVMKIDAKTIHDN